MGSQKRIFYVGMDVHSTNYTVCIMERTLEGNVLVMPPKNLLPDFNQIFVVINTFLADNGLKKSDCEITCGYEAGCLGYSLYRELTRAHLNCEILAPTSMSQTKGIRQKNDWRDSVNIATDMCNKSYSAVWVLDEQDEAVRDLIRCRDDAVQDSKKCKQQITAYLRRGGHEYDKSTWTKEHFKWMDNLALGRIAKDTLTYYLERLENVTGQVARIEAELEEIAQSERYADAVNYLRCFVGIRTYTALALVAEIGDFTRFATADKFAAFLGLVPRDHSSGLDSNLGKITKAGNSNLRRKLIESASGICKGRVGAKSRELLKRQEGNPEEVIAYADRANTRLRRRYWKFYNRGMNRNKAVTAIARELACFIWGMMVGDIAPTAPRKTSAPSAPGKANTPRAPRKASA